MSPSLSKLFVLAAAGLASLVSCGVPEESELDCDETGKCDEVIATPCDGIMKDKSGANTKKTAGRRGDPLAKAVWHSGDSCPTSFSEVMDKLREMDKENCEGERDGIETRAVSETAQALGKASNYRAVVSRTCGNRGTEGIVFSLFGLTSTQSKLGEGFEVMAFDEAKGIFNYYESDGEELNFFGDSHRMLEGPGQNGVARCAGCHTGGGMVMKELDTPWLHWEGHMDTPGVDKLIEKHKNLGSQNSGAELEGVVKNANEKWNKTRIEAAKKAGKVNELLRPLFCTVEVNLDNGADFESPVKGGPGGDEMSGVPFDSLLDPQFKSFGSIDVVFADYDAAIKANGQTVPGVPGAIDTVFDYVFLERSHADNDYVEQLKAAGIIDDAFIKDVLAVDFTRPIFSTDRCALVEFAPDIAAADLKPKALREGFIANLEAERPAAGSPAAVLLKNFKTSGDTDDHDKRVDDFIAACTALGSAPFLANALAITSLNRNKGRELQVFEFESTMPTDNLNTNANARLHPATCQLTNTFVAP